MNHQYRENFISRDVPERNLAGLPKPDNPAADIRTELLKFRPPNKSNSLCIQFSQENWMHRQH